MAEKKPRIEDSRKDNKTELANKIAAQSQKVARTYANIEDAVIRVTRFVSSVIDKILFNRKYGKLTALVLAVLMYFVVNFNTVSSMYSSSLRTAKDLTDLPITVKYNSDTFELSGLPDHVDITISGDASNVTSAANSDGRIVADLEGLSEGVHEVRLKAEGYGDNVNVRIDPSNVRLTLKKKTTQQFDLSYDFINQDKMDSVFSVGTPVFEYNKVNVRASRDTLDSIAFIKALIDVSGKESTFTQEARLVAYAADGNPVSVDIVPDTVHVEVPVTSPNKTVNIEVEVTGEVQDGKAIQSITIDQQTVTIYGSETALSSVDRVVVTLNASSITKDSTILRPVVLPAGVNSSNINQVTMTVQLGERASRTIDDVKLRFKNNVNNYKVSHPENKTTTSVTVYGTAENIEKITAADINVYIDMLDAKPGLMQFPLQVDQPTNGLVRYSLTESTYELNVLGETNDGTDDNKGADVNNG
ncbi:MAG: hypothetical protein IKS37_03420 [Solobacterium sp.]|nr:hypothetical protein [Solobacterium sp.]